MAPNEKFVLVTDFLLDVKRNKNNKEYNKIFEEEVIEYINKIYDEQYKIKFAYRTYVETYEIDFDGLEKYVEYLEKKEQSETSKRIKNLLLFKSLETNKNLMEKVIKLLDSDKEQFIELIIKDTIKDHQQRPYSDIVMEKYKNGVYIFASIYYERLKEKSSLDNTVDFLNQLDTNKNLIFNLDYYPERIGLFYYNILFILNIIYFVKDRENKSIKKIMGYLEWYLPACLSTNADDFYGLAIQVIDIYTYLLKDDEKNSLLRKVFSTRSKILIMSSIEKQKSDFIEEYKRYFDDKYQIQKNDNAKSIIILLNVFISLCIRCGMEINKVLKNDIIEFLEYIKSRFEKEINQKILEIMITGLAYAKMQSDENKNAFNYAMKGNYLPYAALSIQGETNEK